MTVTQWFIFVLVIQIIHGLGTWKLYQKAGRKSWEAFIPVYNAIVLMKIINRPTWWTALLFVPVINLIMFIVIWVETLRSFGQNKEKDTLLAVLTLGFYSYYVNYFLDVEYKRDRSLVPTTKSGDTIASLLYAIVVATLVHTYIMQPFNIPTSSLEKSLLVGDFLFVSKFHYGARTPSTAIAMPMVHDSMMIVKAKSYLSKPQLPSFRFPGLQKIKHNDIVCFNWPADTVYQFFDRSGRHIDKPKDKRSNYVKRCVGLPGDNLSIKEGYVYINNKKLILPERAKPQYSYYITTDGSDLASYASLLIEELKITDGIYPTDKPNEYFFGAVTDENIARIKNIPIVKSVTKNLTPAPKEIDKSIFPHNQKWSLDNFGPIYIPEANKTIVLNKETLPFYKRIITVYEGNTLEEKGGKIYINGKESSNYTFQQDYYWMMGDNRHRSEDSRYWGFVPMDHVVGKPVFIWWSIDPNIPWSKAIDKIRWDRLFCTVGGDGQPTSYFKYFLVALVAWFGFDWYRNKKKKA
ncbi:signal peptidase I [Flavobacterium columnare]|uniref:signal peptidase I n=1 Tax=Flavobacterium columnare TaxID=996 RepID=UPI0007F9E413|nr:signal peptidase I [Flavobacterium columnare]ANO48032.1 signal peptidase I [Flavobacterium columnare]APT21393.1 signal peptidase I [Flavobacterium columnare]